MALGFRQAHGIDRYTKICDIAYGKNATDIKIGTHIIL